MWKGRGREGNVKLDLTATNIRFHPEQIHHQMTSLSGPIPWCRFCCVDGAESVSAPLKAAFASFLFASGKM